MPVVLIHGLASSDRSWGPMIDRITVDPILDDRFQFWTFSYDTCVALPLSASRFRSALDRTRWALDPTGNDPALDRMVLVGQSQGGLIAKMSTQESGWTLWDATFSVRPEAICCSPESRAELVDAFFTRPVPSVGRVIFIATPHHGSKGPAAATARLKERLLSERRESELSGPIGEVVRLNGRGVLAPELRRVPIGAVGGLSWDSPILDALNRTPIASHVRRHSIIPQLGTLGRHLDTDGIVSYESTHLNPVDSEVIVPGPHVSIGRPEVAAEVARILHLHLAEQGS
jgi:pimeloyl-ACP methyl ester carboxylesterase